MTGSMGRAATIVALVATAFAVGATPADAATVNPCKVLKKSEIQRAFGGTVGSGRKGLSTPVSAQCEYQVGANADRPAGTIVVHVMTTRAKAAYTELKKNSAYAPIDAVPNSLYAEKLDIVNVLQGDVLLGVRGAFFIRDPLPIHSYDDTTQLTDLAQIGITRV